MTVVTSSASYAAPNAIAGIVIPDSKLAREVTEVVRDTEPPLLFHHSSRVYYWARFTAKRRGLRFDPELLYAGAMFRNMGRYRNAATQSLPASGGPESPSTVTMRSEC